MKPPNTTPSAKNHNSFSEDTAAKPPAPRTTRSSLQKRGAFLPLARLMPEVLEKKLPASAGLLGRMMLHWPQIVGSEIASMCRPQRILGQKTASQTLELAPFGAHGVILSYQTTEILEKIALFLGYQPFTAIRIGQPQPLPKSTKAADDMVKNSPPAKLSAQALQALSEIQDDEMRQRLEHWLNPH